MRIPRELVLASIIALLCLAAFLAVTLTTVATRSGLEAQLEPSFQEKLSTKARVDVKHAFLGISGTDLSPDLVDTFNLDVDSGALVESVVPNGPADKAGIEAVRVESRAGGAGLRARGEVITAVDGRPVHGVDDVSAAVDAKNAGDEMRLTLLRGGDRRTVTVHLAERPARAGAFVNPVGVDCEEAAASRRFICEPELSRGPGDRPRSSRVTNSYLVRVKQNLCWLARPLDPPLLSFGGCIRD